MSRVAAAAPPSRAAPAPSDAGGDGLDFELPSNEPASAAPSFTDATEASLELDLPRPTAAPASHARLSTPASAAESSGTPAPAELPIEAGIPAAPPAREVRPAPREAAALPRSSPETDGRLLLGLAIAAGAGGVLLRLVAALESPLEPLAVLVGVEGILQAAPMHVWGARTIVTSVFGWLGLALAFGALSHALDRSSRLPERGPRLTFGLLVPVLGWITALRSLRALPSVAALGPGPARLAVGLGGSALALDLLRAVLPVGLMLGQSGAAAAEVPLILAAVAGGALEAALIVVLARAAWGQLAAPPSTEPVRQTLRLVPPAPTPLWAQSIALVLLIIGALAGKARARELRCPAGQAFVGVLPASEGRRLLYCEEDAGSPRPARCLQLSPGVSPPAECQLGQPRAGTAMLLSRASRLVARLETQTALPAAPQSFEHLRGSWNYAPSCTANTTGRRTTACLAEGQRDGPGELPATEGTTRYVAGMPDRVRAPAARREYLVFATNALGERDGLETAFNGADLALRQTTWSRGRKVEARPADASVVSASPLLAPLSPLTELDEIAQRLLPNGIYRSGSFTLHRPDGTLASEGAFGATGLAGELTEYDEAGLPRRRGSWGPRSRHGEWKLLDPEGHVTEVVVYEAGRPASFERRSRTAVVLEQGAWDRAGLKTGTWTERDEAGAARASVRWIAGIRSTDAGSYDLGDLGEDGTGASSAPAGPSRPAIYAGHDAAWWRARVASAKALAERDAAHEPLLTLTLDRAAANGLRFERGADGAWSLPDEAGPEVP